MISIPGKEKARLSRLYTKQAIALAIEGKWGDSIAVNEAILELSPSDVSAYNRLGKSWMELGDYHRAREAYTQSLRLDPHNKIAKKNLDRLEFMSSSFPEMGVISREVSFGQFSEGVGSGEEVKLICLAPEEILAEMSDSDKVYLHVDNQCLMVQNEHGECLGEIEPELGAYLIGKIGEGSEYEVILSSLDKDSVKVIFKEAHQRVLRQDPLFIVPDTNDKLGCCEKIGENVLLAGDRKAFLEVESLEVLAPEEPVSKGNYYGEGGEDGNWES